jgi:hypothetical protein
MRNVLLSACAAILIAMGISAASADDERSYDNRYYGGNWHQNDRGPETVSPGSVVHYLQRQDYAISPSRYGAGGSIRSGRPTRTVTRSSSTSMPIADGSWT